VRPPEAGTALVVVILKVQLVVAPVTLEVGVILQVANPIRLFNYQKNYTSSCGDCGCIAGTDRCCSRDCCSKRAGR